MIRRLIFGVVVLMALLASACATASASITYVTQWGGPGQGPGQFGGPNDLAVGPSGSIFVSDLFGSFAPRIQEFGPQGRFLNLWNTEYGILPGQFLSPGGIASAPSGSVYVGDYAQNRIQRFGPTGDFQVAWGAPGPGEGQFAAPWGVATDPSGRVYVVDYGNNRIQKFGPDGNFLDEWGSFGSGNGQFVAPSFIATDADGHVYVADSGNGRIQKFSYGGRYLGQWAAPGPGAGPRQFPLGVATSPGGDVYVVGTNGIQKYSPDGSLLTRWGEFGRGEGQFRNPQGIATDQMGNVYVGDSGNDRIQKFHDSGPPYPDPGTAHLALTRPKMLRVGGGRNGTLRVRVSNTGSNTAKKVRVCVPRSRGIVRGECVRLGSIAVDGQKVARLAIRTSCRTTGRFTLAIEARASNAGTARSRGTLWVADCRPQPRPPLPDEGLG